MKEIKAYIRCQKAEKVIEVLENIGINDITLIDVMGVGILADPQHAKYSNAWNVIPMSPSWRWFAQMNASMKLWKLFEKQLILE